MGMRPPPRKEIYVSTDIETDGPIPGRNSMLSFASVAVLPNGDTLGTFTVNLETLPEGKPDPKTQEFWDSNRDAYAATRSNTVAPSKAMMDYVKWLDALPGTPVFVGYPAGFDFMFIYWYLIAFASRSPFSFSALDMKTFACATLGIPYRETTKRNMPQHWFSERRHTHVALDDAMEQADLFISMWKHAQRERDLAAWGARNKR